MAGPSPAQVQAVSAKNAVTSAATCSQSTVTTLNGLLLPAEARSKKNISRAEARVTVLEVPDERSPALSARERFILATEIVNASLKTLTEAIKSPPPPRLRRRSSSKKVLSRTASGQKLPSRSATVTDRQLQQRSLNRVSSSPGPSSPSLSRQSSSSSLSAEPSQGTLAVAGCARVAFSCLRALQGSSAAGADLPPLQLESGMSALIGKLITLGFDDLALKDARILKKRLEVPPSKPMVKSGLRREDGVVLRSVEVGPTKETLAGLLRFEQTQALAGPHLALVVATQMHVLKVIASSKRVASIEAACEYLKPTSPSSPINMILQLSTQASTGAKAPQQLAALSQIILSLCPGVSSADDQVAAEHQLSPSPETAYGLQYLAFEVRLLWWRLSGHQADPEKEILGPFARCTSAYSRRSTLDAKEKYETVDSMFTALMGIIEKDGHTIGSAEPASWQTSPLLSIFKTLAALGRDASLYDDAIRWNGEALAILGKTETSEALRCSYLVRLAALTLRRSPLHRIDDADLSVLQEAAKNLEANFRGESADFDALLMELSGLRRAAMSRLADVTDTDAERASKGTCRALVFACVRFLNRYLGSPPSAQTSTKVVLRYAQRKKWVESLAPGAVDSVFSITKTAVTADEIAWDLLHSTLQDCLDLVSKIRSSSASIGSEATLNSPESCFVKASNIYWAYYLRTQKQVGHSENPLLVRCLRKSVDAAKRLSRQGTRAALLAIKLDRLGALYEGQGRFQEARDAFLDAVRTHVDDGVLQQVTTAAASTALNVVWETSGNVAPLGRALAALLRTSLRVHSDINFYDDTSLDAGARGGALEWQFELVLGMLDTTRDPQKYQATAAALADVLLEVYEVEQFPVRRLRILGRLLRLFTDQPSFFSSIAMAKTRGEARAALAVTSLGDDVALGRYLDHHKAATSVSLAFLDGNPEIEALTGPLTAWSRLVDETGSWEVLQKRIDDVSLFQAQLTSIANFFDMRGFQTIRITVLALMARVREWQAPADEAPLVADLSSLGLQYLRLGYSGKAGLILNKAHGLLEKSATPTPTALRWYLCYAEYQLTIGHPDKCLELLTKARSLAEDDPDFKRGAQAPVTVSARVITNRLVADAYHVCSRMAFERGNTGQALACAKRCVKLNYRAWAGLENRYGKKPLSGAAESTESEADIPTEGMSGLAIASAAMPTVVSTTHEALKGAPFWTLVPSLFHGLGNLSRILSHQGMFQEAIYYAQQALRIVEAVDATNLMAENLSVSGDIWARSGQVEKGGELLARGSEIARHHGNSKVTVSMHCYLGQLHRLRGSVEEELAAYDEAERLLSEISTESFINGLERLPERSNGLEESFARLTVEEGPRAAKAAPPRSLKQTTARTKRPVTAKARAPAKSSAASAECTELLGLRGNICRLKALALMVQRRSNLAADLLQEAESYQGDQRSVIQQKLGNARHLLQHSLEKMSADAVFCVLQESTISFPAIAGTARLSSKHVLDRVQRLSPRKSPSRAIARKTIRSASPIEEDFVDTLRRGRESVLQVLLCAMRHGSTSTIHAVSSALSRFIMLSSAASPSKAHGSVHPVMATYAMEMARTLALCREKEAIQIEKQPAKETLLQWPAPEAGAHQHDHFPSDYGRFQKDYIDIIPSQWTVMSISLSDARDELYISKLQAGQTPFILRLPLDRHNSRDADEEIFNFEQGRDELGEIIELANFSAHDARDMSGKGAKTQWWAEREALDARLRDLLLNIENMWLGGFRGVFSQRRVRRQQDVLLARFQQSFHQILDKHLPSRQQPKQRGGKAQQRVTLDPRILELFVGLGGLVDGRELDEPLTDLLYFVVDVLQFHGERNAYDEIDFDSIVVETQDALARYHEAAKEEGGGPGKHTILILDKALHAIPWESLPCLSGQSVSRMPSLGCLRERILAHQPQSRDSSIEGHWAGRDGAYVLNPAGDLKSTQAVFEKDLEDLDWDGIVKRDPSESEMRTALESREVFLYFGHGSGAQYIRARTIRNMERCAVALLMGCSSGALAEAGDFEPHGVPVNYAHAGCPALVATLWDVTDRDIDRFSHELLRRWGLLPRGSAYPVGKGKTNARARAAREKAAQGDEDGDGGPASLSEAVAGARDACILRYLNGAAGVVYGIPVFLKVAQFFDPARNGAAGRLKRLVRGKVKDNTSFEALYDDNEAADKVLNRFGSPLPPLSTEDVSTLEVFVKDCARGDIRNWGYWGSRWLIQGRAWIGSIVWTKQTGPRPMRDARVGFLALVGLSCCAGCLHDAAAPDG
ncbi:MAG: hypothetical protein M1832_002257 [Thelocarpon impressellum]|nr:MAG: hypothetical protein M1832_002257 [Thelocarpon impressellum]